MRTREVSDNIEGVFTSPGEAIEFATKAINDEQGLVVDESRFYVSVTKEDDKYKLYISINHKEKL